MMVSPYEGSGDERIRDDMGFVISGKKGMAEREKRDDGGE
jgi:hypothetical protein